MTNERDDAKPAAPLEPFARRQVTWGRPPSSVFHVGPLPKGPAVSPLGDPRPVRPVPGTGSILSGSMVPAAARPRQPVVTTGEPEWIEEPADLVPVAAKAPPEAPAPIAARPAIDPTVRPLPAATRETLEPLPAPPSEPIPVVQRAVEVEPAPVVAPSYARVSAKRSSRSPLYVGGAVVVLALVAGGVWFASLPSPPDAPVAAAAPVAPAPVAVEPPVTSVAEPVPVEAVTAPVPAAVSAAVPAATVANRPAAARPATAQTSPATATATPRPAQTPPVTRAPAPQSVAPPAITVQPLTVTPPSPTPAPTAARNAPSDPDAPITTRPQPLD